MIFFSDFTTTPDRKYFYGWLYLGLFALDTFLNMLIIASITFLEVKQACRQRSAKKKRIQDAKDLEAKLERDIILGLDKKSIRRRKKYGLEDFALEDALQEAEDQRARELSVSKEPTADNFLRDIPEEEDLDIKSLERYHDSEVEPG